MRKISLRLIVFILAFLAGCVAARLFQNEQRCWDSIAVAPRRVAVAPQQQIPANWKRISLGPFAFFGPLYLNDRSVPNPAGRKPTTNWLFKSDKMTLSVEYGMYVNPLTSYSSEPDYEEHWSEINGRRAKVITFSKYHHEWWYFAAVYFPPGTSGAPELSVWASCFDPQTREDAVRVLHSVEFTH